MSDNINQDIAISGEGNIVVGKGDVIINPLPPAEARLRHDLGILLKNVETTWIKGVLEKSVHEAALLELGMEIREEAVDNPWRMVMEKPDQSRQEIPKGRKIKDIFDEANRLLLILGEPGSGKTTTLLQLARDLISEVDSAFAQPVPVILNLSTWTNKQQPLDEWLIAELNSKYRLPKRDGKQWLQDRRILPLLDGLDEVKAENRVACVEKINQLVNDYGLQGLVVCSRIKDYTDLNVRLAFYRAIYLQPLTPGQVDEYLEKAGDKLVSLRASLQSDDALRSMAQSPLILNIMSLAYQNAPAEDLYDPALATDKARRQYLFDTYIARMFKRKVGTNEYDKEQTKQRLSWLARNMQYHSQDVFLIENLQPSWLQTRRWRLIYILVSRLSAGLILGLSLGLIGGLLGKWTFGLFVGSIVVLALILPASIRDTLRFEWSDKWRDQKSVPLFWWIIINIVSLGLIYGLVYGLIAWLFGALVGGLIVGLIVGLVLGLFEELYTRMRGYQTSPMNDIHTIEALRWNRDKAIKGGLVTGLIAGLFGGVIIALITEPIAGLLSGLIVGLLEGLVFLVFFGFTPEIIETKTTPNQGIHLSARNAVYGGLTLGLIIGLISGLIGGLNGGLVFGVIGGIIGTTLYGGIAVASHYILRFILIIQGHTPANYARFLDYAVDRIFLQKVGGGYRFIHRMLLEHFAEMDEPEKRV